MKQRGDVSGTDGAGDLNRAAGREVLEDVAQAALHTADADDLSFLRTAIELVADESSLPSFAAVERHPVAGPIWRALVRELRVRERRVADIDRRLGQ